MQIFLNGRFVPEKRAVVSVFDRGFLYGDGLFEAVLVHHGKTFRWEEHLQRFGHGARMLNIKIPFAAKKLRAFADELIRRNKVSSGLLRLGLSRGVGMRGYSPKGANTPTFVMSLYPLRALASDRTQWKVVSSSQRLPAGEPLAQFKNCNKLPQILARAEADEAGAEEALLLNTDGFAVEGTTSNLFWMERSVVCTSPLSSGILPGVTRALVLEVCKSLRIKTREASITLPKLKQAEGVFLSMTSRGVVGVRSLDGKRLKQSPLPERIADGCWKIVERETSEQ
ncbi:MAG TPA: aminotransferase class IV [Verrucomicrobiae bacterium]|nr:aminotransferase class IV [Verrucomicrobiae bacterium]